MTQAGMPKDAIIAANKKFHELGLTPRQVKGLVNDWYLKDAAAGNEVLSKQSLTLRRLLRPQSSRNTATSLKPRKGL